MKPNPNPDTGQHYKLERVALWKSGIDPNTCHGSIKEAREKNTEGWEKAEAYLEQLKDEYYNGNNLIIMDEDFNLLIEPEYADNWQPEKENITPVGSNKIHETRSIPSELTIAGLLIKELIAEGELRIISEDKHGNKIKINPSDITKTHIVNNLHRLAKKYNQTLRGMSPATLQRGIKKALDSLDIHYDDPA